LIGCEFCKWPYLVVGYEAIGFSRLHHHPSHEAIAE
jgi:hypothetical protein